MSDVLQDILNNHDDTGFTWAWNDTVTPAGKEAKRFLKRHKIKDVEVLDNVFKILPHQNAEYRPRDDTGKTIVIGAGKVARKKDPVIGAHEAAHAVVESSKLGKHLGRLRERSDRVDNLVNGIDVGLGAGALSGIVAPNHPYLSALIPAGIKGAMSLPAVADETAANAVVLKDYIKKYGLRKGIAKMKGLGYGYRSYLKHSLSGMISAYLSFVAGHKIMSDLQKKE